MTSNSTDADKGKQENTIQEDEEFSVASAIAFNSKMMNDPDSLSDDEIRAEYGDDIDADSIRQAFRRNTLGRSPKNPRTSARAKLRRRLLWLQQALSEVEFAIGDVLSAPGRTNKPEEIKNIHDSIAEFRTKTGLMSDGRPEIENADFSMLDRFFNMPSSNAGASSDKS